MHSVLHSLTPAVALLALALLAWAPPAALAYNAICHDYMDEGLIDNCTVCDALNVSDTNGTTWTFTANMDDQLLECSLEPNATQNVSGTIIALGQDPARPTSDPYFMVRIDTDKQTIARLGSFNVTALRMSPARLMVDPIQHRAYIHGSIDNEPIPRRMYTISSVSGNVLWSVVPLLISNCTTNETLIGGESDCLSYFNLTNSTETQEREVSFTSYHFDRNSGFIIGNIQVGDLQFIGFCDPLDGALRIFSELTHGVSSVAVDPTGSTLVMIGRQVPPSRNVMTVIDLDTRSVTKLGAPLSYNAGGRLFWSDYHGGVCGFLYDQDLPDANQTTEFVKLNISNGAVSGGKDPIYYPSIASEFSSGVTMDHANLIITGRVFERGAFVVLEEKTLCPIARSDISEEFTVLWSEHEPICLCCLANGTGTLEGLRAGHNGFQTASELDAPVRSRIDPAFVAPCALKTSASSTLLPYSILGFAFLALVHYFIVFFAL